MTKGESKSASYLLRISPSEKQRLEHVAAERGLSLAALIRLGLEREEAAYARMKREAA